MVTSRNSSQLPYPDLQLLIDMNLTPTVIDVITFRPRTEVNIFCLRWCKRGTFSHRKLSDNVRNRNQKLNYVMSLLGQQEWHCFFLERKNAVCAQSFLSTKNILSRFMFTASITPA